MPKRLLRKETTVIKIGDKALLRDGYIQNRAVVDGIVLEITSEFALVKFTFDNNEKDDYWVRLSDIMNVIPVSVKVTTIKVAPEATAVSWAERVRALRASMRCSRASLARKLKMSESTLRDWEMGARPSQAKLKSVMKTLERYESKK